MVEVAACLAWMIAFLAPLCVAGLAIEWMLKPPKRQKNKPDGAVTSTSQQKKLG